MPQSSWCWKALIAEEEEEEEEEKKLKLKQTTVYKNASDSHLALVAIVTRSSSIQKLVSNNSELLLLITAFLQRIRSQKYSGIIPQKTTTKENIAYEEHKRFVSTQHEGGTILSNLQAKFHQCRYECTLRLPTRLSSSASEAWASLPNLCFWWSLWVENSQKSLGISSL